MIQNAVLASLRSGRPESGERDRDADEDCMDAVLALREVRCAVLWAIAIQFAIRVMASLRPERQQVAQQAFLTFGYISRCPAVLGRALWIHGETLPHGAAPKHLLIP